MGTDLSIHFKFFFHSKKLNNFFLILNSFVSDLINTQSQISKKY